MITTKRSSIIALVIVFTWLDFGEVLLETYLGKFSSKNLDVFFQSQSLFWPYLRNGGSYWCETKRKCIRWILGIKCELDLRPHSCPWAWMFRKVKFRNSCISGIVGLIDVKWKGSESIRPHPWPWPWSFKVRIWNSLISGMGQPINMKRIRVIYS